MESDGEWWPLNWVEMTKKKGNKQAASTPHWQPFDRMALFNTPPLHFSRAKWYHWKNCVLLIHSFAEQIQMSRMSLEKKNDFCNFLKKLFARFSAHLSLVQSFDQWNNEQVLQWDTHFVYWFYWSFLLFGYNWFCLQMMRKRERISKETRHEWWKQPAGSFLSSKISCPKNEICQREYCRGYVLCIMSTTEGEREKNPLRYWM